MKNRVKKYSHLSAIILIPLILSGCFVTYPKNATDFRTTLPNSLNGEKHSFVVNRPYKKVAATFKKNAHKCFRTDMSESIYYNNHRATTAQRYTPTLKTGNKKLELHVQKKPVGVKNNNKYPKKGYFFVVADAYDIGKGRTRVDIYGPSTGFQAFKKGIKNWAKGSPLGCPDLTK